MCVMLWSLRLREDSNLMSPRHDAYITVLSYVWTQYVFCNLNRTLYSHIIWIFLNLYVILKFVLYGCETWSLTLRSERKLRVFENMVLRRIFGPRRVEVTGEWRRLHKEELKDLYSSPNIVRVIKSGRIDGLGMWRVWVRRGWCIGSWWGNRK